MLLSVINLAIKKGKTLLVMVKSTASNHTMLMLRDKGVDKYEFVRFDPFIERNVIYKETKKLRTLDKAAGASD
jgi:large subunit ribosomal protein L33